jgi:hypothetical protein
VLTALATLAVLVAARRASAMMEHHRLAAAPWRLCSWRWTDEAS